MPTAHELRFAFVFEDFEAALRLFRDVLALPVQEEFVEGDAHGVILDVPNATFEVFNAAQGRLVDEIEVGRPLNQPVRIAIRIDDLAEASDAVTAAGNRPVADAVETPWGDHNRRFVTPDGLQLTLFEPAG